MRAIRDALLVASFDLFESVRSRKFLALLVLHVLGAVVSTLVFVKILAEFETVLATQLGVAETAKPGTMTEELMNSPETLEVLTGLMQDAELAKELVSVPPLALFYGWIALFVLPALVVFTSSDAISAELSSGSARFALFRTQRLSWAVGKLGGQACLLFIMVFLGAIAVWIVGALSLAGFDGPGTAWWLARLGLRAFVYGFAFLGLALGISQMTRSVNGARAFGLIALIAVGVLASLSMWDEAIEYAPVLIPTLQPMFPGTHKLTLWQPDLAARGPSMAMLLALGFFYFGIGHAVMVRRDA
ncbi:MAG TPA: ABC transporter permease subunit [Myxococcota bacterium]|nr:ABC transporter permease subunit [Myxococcota bacterium]